MFSLTVDPQRSTDSLLLQKSFSTRGSCTRESPAMYPAMTDSRQAGITSHAKQSSQTGIVRSARIAKTSRSCMVSGGTPKFFFAALMAAL